MKLRNILAATAVAAATLGSAFAANASLVFVGSWDVYNDAAPTWFGTPPNGPLAYTGQEAAALLFGGAASSYQISTRGSLVANINNTAHYDVIGFGDYLAAEGFNQKYLGMYYGPTSGYTGDPSESAASAFIRDNLEGRGAINYAFRDDGATGGVPEPATWGLMLVGFGLSGVAIRSRRRPAAAAI